MTIRGSLVAMLLMSVSSMAVAQAPVPKTIVWDQRNAPSEQYFGIVGEIERPGVYASAAGSVTLQELIHHAGGFTRFGSPAIRIIRNGRSGQSVFYRPDGQTPLSPNDLVVIDPLIDPRQPTTLNIARASDGQVWLALLGVSDRPEVVWVNRDQTQLPNIMKMLQQSTELARSVRTILPPRWPQMVGLTDGLPNGTVLVFDPKLLVTATLPMFDPPQPMTGATPQPALVADSAVPLPPAIPAAPVSNAMPRLQVDAQPVPFTTRPMDQVPANPASLPAPGSRFAPPPPSLTPSLPTTNSQAGSWAGPPVIVEPESKTEAEIAGVRDADDDLLSVAAAPSTFSLWQLLGITGTVASLVGVAIVSRQYLERRPHQRDAIPPAIAGRMHAAPPATGWRRLDPTPLDLEPDPAFLAAADELREVLADRSPVESEPLIFSQRMALQPRAATNPPGGPVFRLDVAETPAPHLVMPSGFDAHTTFHTDVAADASPVPAPHFRYRSPKVMTAAKEPTAMPPLVHGSSIERALSQLQEGRPS